ncbi:asparagine synthase C-terminal domain-containing protein, partial [Candidatus Woesearchaeota archaeon]|nr:asparagine synthase C-terminal domain-containing protein [Candidatus Woesearchaeota archaeon]
SRYSELYYKKKISLPEKEFRKLFMDTVESQLISDVPLGVFLSGGLDSGTIVSAMRHLDQNIKTFSVGYDVKEFSDDELKKAKKTSDYYNTDHKEVLLDFNPFDIMPKVAWHMDEPISDPASLALYLLSKEARKKVTVVLAGDGADELFGGYEHYKILMGTKKIYPIIPSKKLVTWIIKNTPKPLLDKFFKYSSSLGEKGIERFSKYFLEFGNPAKDYLNINSLFTKAEKEKVLSEKIQSDALNSVERHSRRSSHSLNNFLNIDINTFLQHLLVKVDKMTMAHHLECRVPYLDNNIVNFAFSLPQKYKLRGNNEKYIIRSALKKDLPEFLLKRKKQRFFVPIHYWYKEYNDEFKEILSREKLKEQGLFRYEYIEEIRNKFDRSPLYYGRQIWNLTTFMNWYDVFMEKKSC